MKLFAFSETRYFADEIARELGLPLAALEERTFEDGEHKARPLESVRGENVYVIQSLHGDDAMSPNDKLCRLLFFLATVREHGARSINVIAPYLAYARKDRRTKARDPVTTRYVAQLIEAVGTDLVMTLDEGLEHHRRFSRVGRTDEECRAEGSLGLGLGRHASLSSSMSASM